MTDVTLADLASRLGWLPCEECGGHGLDMGDAEAFLGRPAPSCPSCHGVGWLFDNHELRVPVEAVLEIREAIPPCYTAYLGSQFVDQLAYEETQ
jgi:hypothetical protein